MFHWIIALLILTNLLLGWRMAYLTGMAQFDMFQLHKSVGITVLVLSVARLAWRLANRPPPMQARLKPWERAVAGVTHWLFYVMMIGMPLTGWAMVSVSPYNIPTVLWKTIPWPHLGFLHALGPAGRAQVEAIGGGVHLTLAIGGAVLIVLHIAAALRHQFVLHDGVLGRMLPPLRSVPNLDEGN